MTLVSTVRETLSALNKQVFGAESLEAAAIPPFIEGMNVSVVILTGI